MNTVDHIYEELSFPQSPLDRPYAFINMVATIDGKTVSGTDREPVADLGSDSDHLLMRRIENAADGILIGAGNLRSHPGLWYAKGKLRLVATESGRLDYSKRFFRDDPEKVIVICPETVSVPEPFHRLTNSFREAFEKLRTEYGIERLLIEGGSKLNGELLRIGLVDELFLSLAPKVKLGDCLPTYAGGEPLARTNLQIYEIVEHHRVGNELFVRYRRTI